MVENGLTWAGIKWAFTTGHASNWHPLTWISHMADCQLAGLNPVVPHCENVMFHAANAVLLFALLLRLTDLIWPSAFVARYSPGIPARRIRRMDFGAEGRVEHVLRPADAADLHQA